jgi:hypothetical protein
MGIEIFSLSGGLPFLPGPLEQSSTVYPECFTKTYLMVSLRHFTVDIVPGSAPSSHAGKQESDRLRYKEYFVPFFHKQQVIYCYFLCLPR